MSEGGERREARGQRHSSEAPENPCRLSSLASRLSPRSLSPTQRAWRRFLRNRPAVISGAFLLAVLLIVLVWPALTRHQPDAVSDKQFWRPCADYWFGTDVHGRDLLARVCYGARISLLVGAVGASVSLVIGVEHLGMRPLDMHDEDLFIEGDFDTRRLVVWAVRGRRV